MGAFIAAVLATALGLGFATPAQADPETIKELAGANLTKVIDAPLGTDTSSDKFVFHFAGGGEVRDGDTQAGQLADNIYSDGVAQDKTTIRVRDIVPTIADVELTGVQINSSNSLSNGQQGQSIVQKPLAEILGRLAWPHAGVYCYIVTEKSASTTRTDGFFINASHAEYIMRVYVENEKKGTNSELGNTDVVVAGVTIDRIKDDNGDNDDKEKVDPKYPVKDATTDKVSQTSAGTSPGDNKLAGDGRGRNVAGFTFANEYITGSSFMVKKLYDGQFSDRTKYSTVEVKIYSEAATNADSKGCVVTYMIEGGKDRTENVDTDGSRPRLNGVEDIQQANHYMAKFNDDGWCVLKADLQENGVIRITGEFGPYNPEFVGENGKDHRMTLSTSGLLAGQDYYVIERSLGDYRPTAYVYKGDATNIDPRVDHTGMDETNYVKDPDKERDETTGEYLEPFDLYLKGNATGDATTVFVVNEMDSTKVSPTGILIDNLPYILMVGIPVAVFAAMFVIKHRENAAA
jgi:hypothetical protein